jgi:TonB family protein
MSDGKPCIRCGRSIDGNARACPFCNWDQSEPVPPPQEREAQPVYVPPPDDRWRGKILGLVALVSLVIIAFVVGMFIHGFEPSEVKAAQTRNATTQAGTMRTTPASRSNVTLVPVTGSDAPQSIEQPITSAPPQGPGQQPNDATALPADQYAAAAARAKAEREAAAKAQSVLLDPRSITGPAYAGRPIRRVVEANARTETPTSSDQTPIEGSPMISRRTAAYLEYKPLPRISVDRDITARLNLTVNEDGRVTDVDVSDPIPDMPRLIAAIQNWRFKPATENGTPVTAKVAVDITFHAHE